MEFNLPTVKTRTVFIFMRVLAVTRIKVATWVTIHTQARLQKQSALKITSYGFCFLAFKLGNIFIPFDLQWVALVLATFLSPLESFVKRQLTFLFIGLFFVVCGGVCNAIKTFKENAIERWNCVNERKHVQYRDV